LAHLAQPAFFFLHLHRSRLRKPSPPADLAPPPRSATTTSTEGKKLPHHPSFISPLNGALSPLQCPDHRRLQTRSVQAPSTPATEATRPPPPRLRPIKGRPTLGEDPHTSNTPSLSPHYTHATAVPPSVHCSLDAFQASVLAKLDCSWRPPSFPWSRQAAVARSGR
jgi:hypothetical protein